MYKTSVTTMRLTMIMFYLVMVISGPSSRFIFSVCGWILNQLISNGMESIKGLSSSFKAPISVSCHHHASYPHHHCALPASASCSSDSCSCPASSSQSSHYYHWWWWWGAWLRGRGRVQRASSPSHCPSSSPSSAPPPPPPSGRDPGSWSYHRCR